MNTEQKSKNTFTYALTDLDFLLRSAKNCKKCTFLGNLRMIPQEGNMEAR